MSQTQRQGFLSRFGSAARLMEGQAAESIEQRLTSIERELAAINRRMAGSETPGPSADAPENQ
jgi:hypothetical protein